VTIWTATELKRSEKHYKVSDSLNNALVNRIKKKFKHLHKWAKRQNITCFRFYNRDIEEFPLIIDWLDGHVVAWLYEGADSWECAAAISTALSINPDNIILKHRQKQKGLQQQYEKVSENNHLKTVQENGLNFEINLSSYLDTGLFLDHRPSRAIIKSLSFEKKVLNLFAYTGSFSCYAIDGLSSQTTSVEINPNYCKWIERNFELNGFTALKNNRIVTEDCMAFLRNTPQKYDLIICDPPTFSNSKRHATKTFSIDEDYPALIDLCNNVLSEKGQLFFSTNSRKFKLKPELISKELTVKETTFQTIPEDFKGSKIHKSFLITKT
jgi:23S rRNA (cytosine1962-C5)-methyltransferase